MAFKLKILQNTYIDIHAHISDRAFDRTREELIKKLTGFIVLNSGENKDDNERILEEYSLYPNLLPCVGLHPNEVVRYEQGQLLENMAYIQDNIDEYFAVSEIGLDYQGKTDREINLEKDVLGRILDIAERHGKVCILHSRKSIEELIDLLRSYKVKAIIHNFEGNLSHLSKAIEINAFISISTSFLRFKRDNIIKNVPSSSLFFETDSPALSPDTGINTPLNIISIIQYAANLRKTSVEGLLESTNSNFIRLFGAGI
ncbi:MAG: TatD family hydrolase [Candidatus Parvarchaeota archaeon]|nr:TatD family hydrolase [Candidatus Parvarchaeota archaeon]MCW1301679.1 TatD family hydrolase [Candidatus Parvarchaeota archaeon]